MIRQIKNALVSAFVPGGSGTDLYTQTNSVFTGVSSYLTGGGSSGTTTPFAFLNYIVFDTNFNRVASGHQRVSSVLNAKHLLTLNNINITQKGYVYIWVSNESNQNHNTYFDDLKVTHTKGPVLQEDHYYPFGGSIAALSSTAPLSKPNRYKLSGNEEQTDFDWNVYDFNARTYDPILGRFIQVDPMADERAWVNPYNYVQNNPLLRVAPAGLVDDYVFDEEGKFLRVDENDQPDKLVIENSKTKEQKSYEFNDPETDVQAIKYNMEKFGDDFKNVKFIYNISDERIDEMMSESGVSHKGSRAGRLLFAAWYSGPGGKMDFSAYHLPIDLAKGGAATLGANGEVQTLWNDSELFKNDQGPMVIFNNTSRAYNYLDGGNWLWGNAVQRLGGTQKNAINWSKTYNPGDSGADQYAIQEGYFYAAGFREPRK
ncbi:RHS repeat-associated core domain-containing protein [Roseivirga thermotolerans]|uniref:Bacterial toxin 44 domain-containing protein n=1 Tax=Roseivirga thermotolerans TaxID=1758176 RepID=A0ABQ3I8L7_9BACT|nr:RHS repeat-associated core domain-containing protein [Roseivirga thermotolerans]GHE72294.1 hypothetical protein GCM10011340_30700 [Roseivirga thermotolerans]